MRIPIHECAHEFLSSLQVQSALAFKFATLEFAIVGNPFSELALPCCYYFLLVYDCAISNTPFSLNLVMGPVSIVYLYMVNSQCAISMPYTIFELPLVAEPIRVIKDSISASNSIPFLSLVLQLYFLAASHKFIVILHFSQHLIDTFE
jgi:hypothetical protein